MAGADKEKIGDARQHLRPVRVVVVCQRPFEVIDQ
jgi:hypothetical protein